uniref:SPARK domain-containing protein n=1 Tax=Chenopodium quinoa TaxID=63459 RepID=A0A803MNB1_CHEQI
TVPAFPLQTDSQTCHLDLSDELFGGVNEACGHNLDRSRCCPVLAAWLYAAHARSALELPPAKPPVSPDSDSVLPMMPESDSQKCVNSLQSSLSKRNITLPQPNSTCDTVLCFCGIRLHQIASLSCPTAFNLTANYRNATPTASVRNLEKNCRNSTYAGCTKCLGALEKDGDKGPQRSFTKLIKRKFEDEAKSSAKSKKVSSQTVSDLPLRKGRPTVGGKSIKNFGLGIDIGKSSATEALKGGDSHK